MKFVILSDTSYQICPILIEHKPGFFKKPGLFLKEYLLLPTPYSLLPTPFFKLDV